MLLRARHQQCLPKINMASLWIRMLKVEIQEIGNKHRLNYKLSSSSAQGIEQIELWNIMSALDESLWWMWTPTDQFIGLTGLTATWEKSCNTVNTSQGIAALWWLLSPITCIYSSGCSSQQNAKQSGSQTRATKHIYLSLLWRLRGQNAGSSFFYPSFFTIFTPDRGWSLSSSRSLDSCHHNWLHSPSSLRPVDSRVAAGQPIMKWPWSSVSRAVVLLKQ